RQFGISQTPIREALGRLISDGLVTKTHLLGYRVTPQWTRKQFQDLYEIRLLLEPAAARSAAERISPKEAVALTRLVADMHKAVENEKRVNYGRFALHDSELHNLIAQIGGNQLIHETMSRLHAHMHIFRLYFHNWVTQSAIHEHQAIVDAIVGHNPDEAERTMRFHIEESWNRLQKGF
ncbi:GntR family transcriptional regulator, partial [Mesorhizobium caraganae]